MPTGAGRVGSPETWSSVAPSSYQVTHIHTYIPPHQLTLPGSSFATQHQLRTPCQLHLEEIVVDTFFMCNLILEFQDGLSWDISGNKLAAAKFHLPTIRTQTPHYQPLESGNILLSAHHRESGNIDWTPTNCSSLQSVAVLRCVFCQPGFHIIFRYHVAHQNDINTWNPILRDREE